LKADNNYTSIFKKNGDEIVSSQTLKKMEEELIAYPSFIRIHHSYIVNTQYISKLLKEDNGFLLLHNGTTLPISRRKKKEVFGKLM
jgi:two-component system LytT family response regulator